MFTFRPIRKTVDAILYVIKHLVRDGCRSPENPAIWAGRGCAPLGLLAGTMVTLESFKRLCVNRHPTTGKKLGVRDSERRRAYHNLVISVPKSFSIKAEVDGDMKLKEAFREHCRWFVSILEERVGTRVRLDGQNSVRTTGNAVMALIEENQTRAGDPFLHLHCLIMGNTYDPVEKRWKATEISAIADNWAYLNELSTHDLARRVAALGYELEWHEHGFELACVPKETREFFSKRSKDVKAIEEDIEREAKELAEKVLRGHEPQSVLETRIPWKGKPVKFLKFDLIRRVARRLWNRNPNTPDQEKLTKAERSSLFGKTRKDKAEVAQQTQKSWQEELKRALPEAARKMEDPSRTTKEGSTYRLEDSISFAIDHVSERASVVPFQELERAALKHAREKASLEEIRTALRAHPDLVFSDNDVGFKAHLSEEKELIQWASQGRNGAPPLWPLHVPFERTNLSQEQHLVAQSVLHSTDRVIRFQGGAGTGKTTTLKAIGDALNTQKIPSIFLAPTRKAVRELERKGLHARTLQSFLEYPPEKGIDGHVIFLDEASMVSLASMVTLKRLVEHSKGTRTILSGDTKQYHSVQYGDSVRLIDKFSGIQVIELKTIVRQQESQYREVVRLSAEGKTDAALTQLIQMNAVYVAPDAAALCEGAADEFVKGLFENGKTPLVVTPTWKEAEQVTEAIRERLKKTTHNNRFPVISQEESKVRVFSDNRWTLAQRKDILNYKPGMLLQFNRSTPTFGLSEYVTVHSATTSETTLHVTRANGQLASVPLKEAVNFSVGTENYIPVARGDRLLLRANPCVKGLVNGGIVEVAAVTPASIQVLRGRTTIAIPRTFLGFCQGFAIPAQMAQGASCKHLIQYVEFGSRAVHAKQFYVSVSRGVSKISLFTTDLQALKDRIKQSNERPAVIEVFEHNQNSMAREQSYEQTRDSGQEAAYKR